MADYHTGRDRGAPNPTSPAEILAEMDRETRKEFDSTKRILAFDEYLDLLTEAPQSQMRGSARYVADMMEWFGRENVKTEGGSGAQRFKVFDQPPEAYQGQIRRVIGHEQVQNHLFRALKTFTLQGINNRLLLLHGPNGSAKSSIAHALMGGMESYSHEKDGAVYTFNWVFPVERYTKGGIGLGSAKRATDGPSGASGSIDSYAKMPDEEIAARIPCDLKDHPLLLVPREGRRKFLERALGTQAAAELWDQLPHYLSHGDLCHRCRMIFDSLLASTGGDLKRVLAHVQVERFFFSLRYRRGLVTIEPQLHVDAQYHQLTYNRSMGALPASLQGLNLFALTGDLIEGNRGLIEYSDLLKRPVDSFKYLLGACESGSISVGSSIAYLDTVLVGSANELQLDAFKEFPDFTSFKARIETIRVPYLLAVSQETEIYQSQLRQIAGEKHAAPHVAWAAALWAVLTRLKKPNAINYPPNLSQIVGAMTPLEKSKLYDTGEIPSALSPEDRKILRASIRKLREEYTNIPYYEGRTGASAREMKAILFDAAQNSEFACLSPLAVFRELEEFIKNVSEYEFLKHDVKDGYHDAVDFINTVRTEYLNRVDLEVRDSIGLYETKQWEQFIRNYVQQLSYVLKKEKVKNTITGKMEEPDHALIGEFEKIVDAPSDGAEKDAFRQNIISQVGAWSLDHPGEQVHYANVFPDFWRKLEKHYYESQKALLTKMHDALLVYDNQAVDENSEGGRLARQTVKNMQAKLGYCEKCAKEVIIFLMRQRY